MAKRITPVTPPPVSEGELPYIVTDKAPPKVAGRRVVAGQELTLTEDQARYELQMGHIALKPASKAE